MKVHILFEPRDLWIGVYWDRQRGIYLCIIPCFPIHITFTRAS